MSIGLHLLDLEKTGQFEQQQAPYVLVRRDTENRGRLETSRRFDFSLNLEVRDSDVRNGVGVGVPVSYGAASSRCSRKGYPDVVEVFSLGRSVLPRGNLLGKQRVIAHIKGSELVSLQVGMQKVVVGRWFVRRWQIAAEGKQQAQCILCRQIVGGQVPFGKRRGVLRRPHNWLQLTKHVVVKAKIGGGK